MYNGKKKKFRGRECATGRRLARQPCCLSYYDITTMTGLDPAPGPLSQVPFQPPITTNSTSCIRKLVAGWEKYRSAKTRLDIHDNPHWTSRWLALDLHVIIIYWTILTREPFRITPLHSSAIQDSTRRCCMFETRSDQNGFGFTRKLYTFTTIQNTGKLMVTQPAPTNFLACDNWLKCFAS